MERCCSSSSSRSSNSGGISPKRIPRGTSWASAQLELSAWMTGASPAPRGVFLMVTCNRRAWTALRAGTRPAAAAQHAACALLDPFKKQLAKGLATFAPKEGTRPLQARHSVRHVPARGLTNPEPTGAIARSAHSAPIAFRPTLPWRPRRLLGFTSTPPSRMVSIFVLVSPLQPAWAATLAAARTQVCFVKPARGGGLGTAPGLAPSATASGFELLLCLWFSWCMSWCTWRRFGDGPPQLCIAAARWRSGKLCGTTSFMQQSL
mmetsp:Transcript_43782/g.115711  ORF Transcript_43782/g.115711 Transcript_43782/m.115711 type:complete len:263 (-) Transcript_43782:1818-2606(-)